VNPLCDIEKYHEQFSAVVANPSCRIFNTELKFDNFVMSFWEILRKLKAEKKTLFMIGNGASCSMTSHFSVDLTKNAGVHAVSFTDAALITCFSNDFSYETANREMLKRYMREGDVLFAISSSGRSANIINAVKFVREKFPESCVVGFSGFSPENSLHMLATHGLHIKDQSYGIVESAHSYLLHMMIDLFIAREPVARG